jgi:hypothetical protein
MPGYRLSRFGFLTGGRQLYRPFQEIRHVVAKGKYRRVAFGVVSAITARLTALIAPPMPASLGFTAFPAILVARLAFVILPGGILAIGSLVMILAHRLGA